MENYRCVVRMGFGWKIKKDPGRNHKGNYRCVPKMGFGGKIKKSPGRNHKENYC